MRAATDTAQASEMRLGSRLLGVTGRRVILVVTILFSISGLALFNGRRAAAVTHEALIKNFSESSVFAPAQDYSKFSHSNPREHLDLMGRANCVSCHRRSDSSPTPRLPVHKDCTGCHLVQFTASTSSDNPICAICHTKDGLNSSNPPTKNFSGLLSFAAKFDHAQHMQGIESARPGQGCATCHTPTNRGAAEIIPARLSAHQTCYQCHSPGKQASNFSSCGSCHSLGRYSRTPTVARAYRVGFSHTEHSERARLTCGSCHNVLRRGLPQARQVSSILLAQHNSNPRARSCVTCHNDQRAFGDTRPEFNDCGRCHKQPTFKS
jgi:c(7)-type cytochrome triheme protein